MLISNVWISYSWCCYCLIYCKYSDWLFSDLLPYIHVWIGLLFTWFLYFFISFFPIEYHLYIISWIQMIIWYVQTVIYLLSFSWYTFYCEECVQMVHIACYHLFLFFSLLLHVMNSWYFLDNKRINTIGNSMVRMKIKSAINRKYI